MTVRVNAFNTSAILGTAGARRTWAALTAACYLWMSTVVALRHTDVLVPVTPESIPAYGASAPARQGDLPEHFNRAGKSRSQPQECAACEWQGVNVSPALAVVRIPLQPAVPELAVPMRTGFARASHAVYSSRAPPLL